MKKKVRLQSFESQIGEEKDDGNGYRTMTDTSSSGNAPSSVVCPLAKLGRLSPAAVRTPYEGFVGSSPPLRSRRFKSTSNATTMTTVAAARAAMNTSCQSLEYKSSSSSSDQRLSDISSCYGRAPIPVPAETIIPYTQSPAFRYHQHSTQRRYESPVQRNFYVSEKTQHAQDDGNISPIYYQTSLGYHSAGRTSPYLDQGYHTLVSVSPPGWPATSVTTKYKKIQQKCGHVERLPDVVLLQIFSWLSTNELCFVSRVCRRWYNLAWDPTLWKTITLHGEGICGDKAVKSILRRLCGQGQNGSCCCVKELFIYDGAKISDKGLTSLSRRCTELTHVQLQNCPTLTDCSVSELVSRCPGIQHLDLTGCSLVSCINIIPGPDLSQKLLLQHLDLTDCTSVQDSSLRIILRNCPQLTFLYLRRCIRITDAGIKFIPSFCSSLRELSVSDCHLVTDFALYELAMLGSNLRYLSVAKCGQVSDAGLKMIAKRCYKLRYLNVRGCEAVSDDALTAVARSCPRLRALDIGKCDVSDAGLKVLAENCPNLKKLSLRNCDLVTDRGIQYVCYYCRGLQQLNIQDCQISLEGYKAVKRFCKRCIIEHTNPAFF